jgi:inorganic triphosphatase YgiF
MDQHLEIEAKYDLAAEADLPDLTAVEGVDAVRQQPAVTLTATYYDTADHALLRRGVTLRRREGGADEGWHLKVKVARGERLELRRPLGPDAVPPTALTDLLTVLAPTAQLGPVATLLTHRTVLNLVGGDVVLAEVADDVVAATRDVAGNGGVAKDGERTIWREVEVELVDGDRALLNRVDKVLRREGLHPSASTSKVGRVLAPEAPPDAPRGPGRKSEVSEVVLDNLRRVTGELLADDPMLRLGRPGAARRQADTLRRSLTLLALVRSHQVSADTRPVERDLAWVLGAVQDVALVEEAAAAIDAILREEPRTLVMGPVRRRADREVAAASKAATATLLEVLGSPRYAQAVAALEQIADIRREDETFGRAAKVLPVLSRDAAKRLERRLGRLAKAATVDETADRAEAATRTSVAVLVTDAAAADVAARTGVPRGVVLDCRSLLWQLDVHRRAQELVREMGVQAHLAGENAFNFGRAHGLLERSAAGIRKRLARRRKQLRSHRRNR